MTVSYRGGAQSRPGTAYVGKCLQAASVSKASIPPRLIKFQFNIYQSYILEFGDAYMRVIVDGAYVTETPQNITAINQALPGRVTVPGHGYANGDWVYIAGVNGMSQINFQTFIISNVTANTFTLLDIFGDIVSTVNFDAYTSGGQTARIYTNKTSPYAAVDLPYLKTVQSADVMSICCVNQQTGAEYPPYDLTRVSASNWTFTKVSFASTIAAPATCTAAASVTTAGTATQYAYCVTAVDPVTGNESIASPIANVTNSVNIAVTAGSITITWATVPGASKYNIYKAPPSYATAVPIGSAFGYAGSSFGNQFVDTNITQDMAVTPPLHLDPFSPSAVLGVNITAGGAAYVQASTTVTISTATGSEAILIPIIVGGQLVAIVVQNAGRGYLPTDTVNIVSGVGSGASATLVLAPADGTYPSVVSYFQQRRVYASTLNNPDTYFMSQTGSYKNFDSSNPPVDADSIIGTPWGTQVNGIQWLQPMPGGLLAATGEDVWQISGINGVGSPVTPAQQAAQAQESNGFSPTVKPLKINYDILYVSSFSSTVYDLVYNFWNNIYAGTDVSVLSNHLFESFNITQWAWAKQPFKVVWATRNDGKFLSLTFLKEQEVVAWARHDTNGLVVGNEVATEPPVNAPYFIVQRYIVGKQQWAYFVERMDNRLWEDPDDVWCVDCGLALGQNAPNATITASQAVGAGNITGGYIAEGGQNYVAPSAQIIDPLGTGSGGSVTFTLTGGVITGFSFVAGQNYSPGTYVTISDATGSDAVFVIAISQNVFFNTSVAVFTPANVGDVIRMGGGIATVTQYLSTTQVVASITTPVKQVIPNDPYNLPVPHNPGEWTITTPVTTITNLGHLEGMQVSALADGVVVAGGSEPTMTVVNGSITLPNPATSVKVGLGYICQYQTLYPEIPGKDTIQGRRKRVAGSTFRLQQTRGATGGCDQPVASTFDSQPEFPWENMQDIPDFTFVNQPGAMMPLWTGDRHIPLQGAWYNHNGFEPAPAFVAVQQTNPLPLTVLAVIPSIEVADDVR